MECETFLNGLLGVINQPVFAKDENFIYTFCNQAFADYVGFSKEQIIGTDVFQLYDRENAEIYYQADVELLKAGGSQHYEALFQTKARTGQTVIFHKSVLTAPNGKKIGIIGLVEIITELKKKEKELNESESKYKKIFENVQDIFYQIDLNGIVKDISPSISRYSDYTQQEIIGQSIDMFYANPEVRNSLLQEIQEKGEALDFEIKLKGKNNQSTFASVNAHFITDENGQISGVEGTLRDLTERKQANEKIKLSISLLQATLDSTADSILVIDGSGRITSFNKQFRQMFGLSAELLESGDDEAAIQLVLGLLKSPEQFVAKIHFLYDNPELDSFDTIEFKDGRIIERFSCPQRLDGIPIGRVWSFRDVTARKNTEDQLNLMGHTLKCINECISITDCENRLLFVNEAFLNTYGYTENEILCRDVAILRSPGNDPKIVNKILDRTSDSGWHGEILNRRKDGTDFLISLSTTIVKNEKGEMLGMVGVATDITERKKIENELKKSEEKYRLLIENQGEGLTIVDQEENLLFANPAAEAIFGVEPGMLVCHNLREFIAPEQFERVREESGKRAKNEKSSYEVDILTPLGIRKNLLVTATPQIDENGIHVGTFGVLHDITARKQAEELLRQSEEKYRNLIETMPDGVYRSTHEGKFVEVNPAMVKMLGYESKEELLDIDIKSQLYFAPEDRESLILDTSPVGLEVFPMKKKDSSTVWIEDHGWYIKDVKGKILFHEGILRDVTERKMAELQLHKYSVELQELNATKDKFFSIIAHDLKNPFNSIIGLSEIMKNEAKYIDIAAIEQYAGMIYTTSSNTFRLLENLLDWARMQQGKMPFIPKSLIFKELVNEVFELQAGAACNKTIILINSIQENLIIHTDANMIKTVIRNLVSNAIKYTSPEGTIEVLAITDGVSVQVTVRDNGTGIKREDIGKLFKIESNFTRRGTENESGTGLGLILCKEFIEKHQGSIWVESEVGKGSEFKFTLPV